MSITKLGLGRKLHSFIVEQKCLPWRVSNTIELWLERWARKRIPPLYRLIRFGRLRDIVQPVTQGPNHHFFGYYDKSPWNASGSLLLSHEVQFNDRPPTAHDPALIGIVRLSQGNRFEPLVKTYAWNWQQGSMLRWHPSDPEKLIMYNDRREDHFVGIVRNVENSEVRIYNRPFYAVTPDGRFALSLNFARLHVNRPGYGYAGISDPWADDPHPSDDGIYRMDIQSGDYSLILSLRNLATYQPDGTMASAIHWVNHLQINPDGTRFVFLHRWKSQDEPFCSRLFFMALDGSELKLVLDYGMVSHYDWFDKENLLVWARHPLKGDRYYFINVKSGTVGVIGDGVLTCDGHCSFSPGRKWVLTDTYPDRHSMRTLMLYRISDGKKIDVDRFYSPKEIWGEIRCDLHPRWSPDGTLVCIDSVHGGQRQVYIVDVSSYTGIKGD